jgi:nucleosome binding factor SPN SPT16 subunit
MLEFAFTPSVQANSHFDLNIGAQGSGKLTADTVLVGIGVKY